MTPPFDSYVICTSPRSGSTLLCKMLQMVGGAGHPESHFHANSVAGWLATYNLDESDFTNELSLLRAVFDAALRAGRGHTNLFGLRLQRGSFDFFMDQAACLCPDATTDMARIQAVFGATCFIHLSRADKVAQAVSLHRAQQSGLWHRAADGSELERLAPPKEPQYDGDAIQRCMDELVALDTQWTDWFVREGITPLQLSYEELAANPLSELGKVLTTLGVPAEASNKVTIPTAKLADAQSRDWTRRFRENNR